jgi:DNA repair exonuclease SbcCD ATPase subunit
MINDSNLQNDLDNSFYIIETDFNEQKQEKVDVYEFLKKNITYQRQLDEVQNEIQSLKEENDQLKVYKQQLDEVKNEIQSLKKENDQLKVYKQQLDEVQIKIQSFKEENDQLKVYKQQLDEVQNEIQSLKEENDQLKNYNSITRTSVGDHTIDESKQEVYEFLKKNITYQRQLDEVQIKNQSLKEENDQLKVYKQQLDEVKNEIQSLKKENDQLKVYKQQLDEVQIKIQSVKEENDKLLNFNSILRTSNSDHTIEENVLRMENNNYDKENRKLLNSKKKLSEQINELKSKNNLQKAEIMSKLNEIKSLSDELHDYKFFKSNLSIKKKSYARFHFEVIQPMNTDHIPWRKTENGNGPVYNPGCIDKVTINKSSKITDFENFHAFFNMNPHLELKELFIEGLRNDQVYDNLFHRLKKVVK